MYVYQIEVRNEYGNFYTDNLGVEVGKFSFEEDTDERFVELVCQREVSKYTAICKEGAVITIFVFLKDSETGNQVKKHTYYGNTNQFLNQ